MNVLGHCYVAEHVEREANAHVFESLQERLLHLHPRKKRLAMVTAKGEEVALS